MSWTRRASIVVLAVTTSALAVWWASRDSRAAVDLPAAAPSAAEHDAPSRAIATLAEVDRTRVALSQSQHEQERWPAGIAKPPAPRLALVGRVLGEDGQPLAGR